jgi:hypothetical protein
LLSSGFARPSATSELPLELCPLPTTRWVHSSASFVLRCLLFH